MTCQRCNGEGQLVISKKYFRHIVACPDCLPRKTDKPGNDQE